MSEGNLSRTEIPSHFESFGLVALGTWADSLAVVAVRSDGLTEVVGDTGIMVPPADPAARAEALCCSLKPGVSLRLAQAGQRRLVENFSARQWIDASTSQYRLAIHHHVLGKAT